MLLLLLFIGNPPHLHIPYRIHRMHFCIFSSILLTPHPPFTVFRLFPFTVFRLFLFTVSRLFPFYHSHILSLSLLHFVVIALRFHHFYNHLDILSPLLLLQLVFSYNLYTENASLISPYSPSFDPYVHNRELHSAPHELSLVHDCLLLYSYEDTLEEIHFIPSLLHDCSSLAHIPHLNVYKDFF